MEEGIFSAKNVYIKASLEQKKDILREEERANDERLKKQEHLRQKLEDEKSRKIEAFIELQKGIPRIMDSDINKKPPNSLNLVEVPENTGGCPTGDSTKETFMDKSSDLEVKKKTVDCPIGSHGISLKRIFPVNFTSAQDNDHLGRRQEVICPACRKTLTNSVKLFALRTCGHIFCKLCTGKFILTDKACFVCGKKCIDPDIIQLSHEGRLAESLRCQPISSLSQSFPGTGFAGHGGRIVAETYTVAFQG